MPNHPHGMRPSSYALPYSAQLTDLEQENFVAQSGPAPQCDTKMAKMDMVNTSTETQTISPNTCS
eukprot:579568-Amphidinium_carterae.1